MPDSKELSSQSVCETAYSYSILPTGRPTSASIGLSTPKNSISRP
ncbi:hypothetical protein K788_0000420 [Paraburkholderia caribensis MBA4]|uniref:Uncharacterized protein n=1 Tax=Paraburkholderia caribensis MBA4 TaxID=1323664 RepID=A0A0P0RIG1_9BURK|nr:hypothetical protein K788_0000420 [Paraburkholderia caribensis MBA4]